MIDYESMSDLQLGDAATVAIHGEELKFIREAINDKIQESERLK